MSCKDCNYRLKDAKVKKVEHPCHNIKLLRLKLEKGHLKFKPGQFIMLSVFGYGEVAVGITTPSSQKNYFEVCIKKVGMVTKAIHELKVGDNIGVRGPYGNGFDLDIIKNKDVIIMAGGIGIAPLRSLIQNIKSNQKDYKSIQVLYGAKAPHEVLYNKDLNVCQKFADVMVTVDNPTSKWKGHRGVVTNLLDKIKVTSDSVIVTCGPPVMYKYIIPKLEKLGIKDENIQILLERRMKCGIGKCQHCTFGDKYVCLDGPVFKYSEIKENKEAHLI